jgi:uncharacterized protein (UPF0333 family)
MPNSGTASGFAHWQSEGAALMELIPLLIVLVVIGVGLYLLQLVPMDATVKKVIQVIAIAAIVIWALKEVLKEVLPEVI